MNGRADGAPRDRRGVGEQVERGGVKRLETKADHERTGDCDGSAKSRGAFDKCAKAESDKEELQAAIRGDRGDGLFHDFELPGLYGNVVEKNNCDDNPHKLKMPENHTVE